MSDSAEAPSAAALPLLPIKNTMLLPYVLMPVTAGRPGSIAAVEAALAHEDKMLLIFAQKDASVEQPQQNDLYAMGTKAIIKRMNRTPNGIELVLQGFERVHLEALRQTEPYLAAEVHSVPLPDDSGTEVDALQREILQSAGKMQELAATPGSPDFMQALVQIPEPLHLVYLLASMLSLSLEKEQSLLEAPTRLAALRLMHEYLKYEIEVLQLRLKIANEAVSELSREQKNYHLRQQMREIQEELGETDQGGVEELAERVAKADLPDEIRKEAERELERLRRIPGASPESQVSRSYLELVLELPWKTVTEDNLDLARARTILDEDHYDLKEIKERILEQLAVLKLNPGAKAPIMCFVGPPGVGKTSLGKSIARALGRKFERLSLGGMHDEAELRGHRRTYIGSMPGRIIQAVRRAGARNPVLMLDEVDKMGSDYRGDPAAALLEILDPAQNYEFRDNYLDLPFDLSKVFFITTANTLDTIPGPLLDRMELLRLSGYGEDEKLQIAQRYLLERQRRDAGLTGEQIQIPEDTLRAVIRNYTREAGVRQLERTLGRLARRVALKFAEGQTASVTILPSDLSELLGPEAHGREQARKELPPGVATGLAWTEAGGDVLYVEAIRIPGVGQDLTLTGQLGNVMQESARAAHSYVLAHARVLGIAHRKGRVHLHVPAGAIPKDGPSAGVTMATALASLYTRLAVRPDTAMTGEISLTGLVLPVGGIKEKVLAARRAGYRRVILPIDNKRDIKDLSDAVRSELEFIFAERVEEVWAAAIPELAERLAANAVEAKAD